MRKMLRVARKDAREIEVWAVAHILKSRLLDDPQPLTIICQTGFFFKILKTRFVFFQTFELPER